MNTNPWIDVTRPVYAGMPVWPGDPDVSQRPLSSIADGKLVNVTQWTLGSHTGTHVDAPRHFIGGAAGVPDMDVNVLCGHCRVIDLSTPKEHISDEHLPPLSGIDRLIIKTRNSFTDAAVFHEDFIALTETAASAILRAGIRLIGIDGPSIERFNADAHPVHHAILGAGIAVLENLVLADIEPGDYELICAPLPLHQGDGAPCRALLRRI